MPLGVCRKFRSNAIDTALRMHKNTFLVIYPGEKKTIDKPQRQAALLRLIRARPVENQEQIVALMRREGVRVTQASVSRDIREMGLVKLAGRYVPAAQALAATADGAPLELEVGLITGLEPIGANLVVVKTRVGAASSVAVVLDHELGKIAAGTIAGDDTVFVAVRSRCDQGRVVAQLNAWLRDKARRPSSAPAGQASPTPAAEEGADRMTKKAVLAFSGGLDTTYCAAWLREAGYAVHSVAVQTGGFDADELLAIERRAADGRRRRARDDRRQD